MMKPILALLLAILAVMTSAARANDYVYDAQTPNWFDNTPGLPGWNRETNNQAFFAFAEKTNCISVFNQNANWNVPATSFAGATWTAPVGEVVVKVSFVFDGVYGASGAPQLVVQGGTNGPSVRLFASDIKADVRNKNQTGSVTCEASENIRVLQIRNWYCAARSPIQPKWFSRVTKVIVTTASVAR